MSISFRLPDAGLEDLNRDGKISHTERAISTVVFCAGLWLFLQLAYAAACILIGINLLPALKLWARAYAALSLILIVIIGIVVFWRRMTEYEKREARDDEDRHHQRLVRQIELERLQLELANIKGVSDHQPTTTYHQSDVDAAALRILQWAYHGQPWTREAWTDRGEKAGLWNEANALFKARDIREGNTLVPEDFPAAWALYLEGKVKAQPRRWKDGLRDTQ